MEIGQGLLDGVGHDDQRRPVRAQGLAGRRVPRPGARLLRPLLVDMITFFTHRLTCLRWR